MSNGDYLWRVNDHGKTHREIARHSRVDAEAYDEFGKAMQAMCRFVKPILSMVPPDPATLDPHVIAADLRAVRPPPPGLAVHVGASLSRSLRHLIKQFAHRFPP